MNKKIINTPYFLIDTNQLDELLEDMKNSFYSFWSNGIIGYSFKTNNLCSVISYMKDKELFAEVVSSDEYLLAKKCNYPINQIIFNGPAKRKKEFIEAVDNGAIVNLETKRELRWLLDCNKEALKKSKLGIRVNFCIEDYCPNESQCGEEDGRFGFSYEAGELKEAILFFKEHKIKISGIHLHCSSKTRSLNIYKAISEVALKVIKEYSLDLNYIDVGGGFFGGVEGKPTFKDYFDTIYKILSKDVDFTKTNIIIEPGMALIGASMNYVTSVIDVKKTKNNTFAVLDGSRIHIDPLMRKSMYTYDIIRKKINLVNSKVDQILCGFTCMENDRFFKISDFMLNETDQIIFKKVGAYTISLSPQFIELHPDIYILKDGQIELVQSRKEIENFRMEGVYK